MQGNPFIYGNPISDPRQFFGRSREVEQIFGRLHNAEFESSSVVGERRMGKTSLLKYLVDPGIRAAHGLGPERYSFVYVDLQIVDETMGPEQLWRRLLMLMRRECADPAIVQALAALERCERLDIFDLDEFFQEVDDRGQHVVFVLDDLERVTTNSNFGTGFYYGLRSLVIHHRVALVTSSRLELVELLGRVEGVKSSPFFNIFANINLRLFSNAECRVLVSESLRGTGVQFSEVEMRHVLDAAGLHPYFLQEGCWALYESYRLGLDEEVRIVFLEEQFRVLAIPHLAACWDDSNDYERIVLTAAALLERRAKPMREFSLVDLLGVFSRGEPALAHLEKRGLLIHHDAHYRLFSSMLGPWILVQITAEAYEEQSYSRWLAENRAPVERVTGEQGRLLREILPGIRAHYRGLVVTWASDPQTIVAMAELVKNELSLADRPNLNLT